MNIYLTGHNSAIVELKKKEEFKKLVVILNNFLYCADTNEIKTSNLTNH